MIYSRKNQKGQAVLIVLLSLSVVLIIVLYIMSRSITDISLSSKDEDSMRAFSAAEAGIERALVIGSDIETTQLGNASFSASVTNLGSGQNVMVYPNSLKSGEIAAFWFARPSETTFTGRYAKVCWGSSASEPPAIEVTIYYKSSANVYKVARVALDPDPTSARISTNYFTLATTSTCLINGESFNYQSSINMNTLGIVSNDVLQFMTVKPLYNTNISHKIGIDVSNGLNSGSLLPSQGVKINSDGTFGGSNRSIEVYQLHPVAPSILLNSLYSSSGITK